MYITEREQHLLFDEYNTPIHVQRHCNEVARVTGILAEALDRHGYHIDVKLVYGAALVHDVVRPWDQHAIEGGKILARIGFPKEAELVRRHMTYGPFHRVEDLEEIDVLCLADRTVKENHYVGIDIRMDYLLKKPNMTEQKKEKINQARESTRLLIHQIEGVLDCTFEQLFS